MSCRHLRVLAVMYFSEWAPAFCEIFSGLWYTLKFLFLMFHVFLEQYSTLLTPPLWKTVHCFSPPGKDLLFSNHSLLSAPSFPLSTHHCYWEGSTAFHWRVYGVRITAYLMFAGWHVAVRATTYLWYSSEIFQVLHSRAYQGPPTAVIPLQSLTCESWLVTGRYTMQWIIFRSPPHRLLIVAVVTIQKSYHLPAVTPQWY